jgi:hypothetical protein
MTTKVTMQPVAVDYSQYQSSPLLRDTEEAPPAETDTDTLLDVPAFLRRSVDT